jgi:outer membrane protein
MNKILFSAILLLVGAASLYAQQKRTYDLREVIEIAIAQSPDMKRAETLRENRYWNYRVFRSNYVPQLNLEGTLPNFNRSVIPVQQPDGNFAFQPVFNNFAETTLSLSQSIPLTGGQVFVNSSLNRFDNFTEGATLPVRYGGNPLSIGFFQPIFGFNQLKWDKRIEPLRYEESQREFVEEYERISRESAALFFDLLRAQIDREIALNNLANNDTIYKIAEGRFELGKIPENDLLQLELNLMNSRQAVAQADLDLETSQLRMKAYLGIRNNEQINLKVPDQLPSFLIPEEIAIAEAKRNRQEAISFKRRVLEAERDVARAKGETGLRMNLFGSFGLTNQDPALAGIYQGMQDQQQVRLGFTVPIVDWGRQEARLKTSQAFLQLTQYTVEQDEINFEQEIFTQVKRFKMLRDQVEITRKADEISLRRYEIAKNRYLIGKISITDLSLALTEKDVAKRAYLLSLGNYWEAYYNIRQLTLYDFENNVRLIK